MPQLPDALTRACPQDLTLHRPEFFRLASGPDTERMAALLEREPRTVVYDQLHSQLTELVRSLNPSVRFTKEELDAAAQAHLKGIPAAEYGVWVYYPWSFRLVHLLDEAEFALVRTDRNRNKITREEQAILATKKVGVIGLSVGQSVSLTMALERSFGEIRLADFDTLELSNLNRIRSGVHEMGVPKVINTAREIAEIDPFLQVTCFEDGITTGNIDAFLTVGGKLDVLIEECDSVAIKIMARQKARALRIPVVMDTSDRGMVDVERFDLEPDRPILHGLVEHLDLELAAKARTNEEKLPFILPIAGVETLSARMKASMLEVQNSITTWPQLASSVALGGAIGGHSVRRILLDQELPSGRWYIDPDELFGVTADASGTRDERVLRVVEQAETISISEEQMLRAAQQIPKRKGGIPLPASAAKSIAEAGCHAPSGGNSQPWKFLHHEGRLFIFMDAARAHSSLDPGLRYAFLGMGACSENMLLEARKLGFSLTHTFLPLPDLPQLVAVLEAEGQLSTTERDPYDMLLAGQIALRCTNRKNSEELVMSQDGADDLTGRVMGKFPLTPFTIVRDRERIDRIAELCGKAERIRFLNATCHRDMFVREMRWNKEEAENTMDGIDVATLELSLSDRTGLRIAADPKARSLLRLWGVGNAMENMAAKQIRASSALAIISIPDLGLASTYTAGRAMQRFWLHASSKDILAHPVGAPIFMGIHRHWDKDGILSAEEHHEAGVILEELTRIIGVVGGVPFFMLRLGKAGTPTARSLRRPLAEVFHTLNSIMA